jgi:hypothetical protein
MVETAIGLLVIEIKKGFGFGGTRVSYTAGILHENDKDGNFIDWLPHKGVRKTGDGYVHVVEINGKRVEFAS